MAHRRPGRPFLFGALVGQDPRRTHQHRPYRRQGRPREKLKVVNLSSQYGTLKVLLDRAPASNNVCRP